MKHKSIDSQKHALKLDFFFKSISSAPDLLKKTKSMLHPSGPMREKSFLTLFLVKLILQCYWDFVALLVKQVRTSGSSEFQIREKEEN